MKLKDIINDAANIYGIDAPEGSTNWSMLFRCANITATNVACNYRDCIGIQTFNVKDSSINYADFDEPFLKVKSIKSDGQDVYYDIYTNFISVPNGRVTVKYAYVPRFTSGEDDIDDIVGGILNDSTLLYGILAEYASICGVIDDANLFDEKFQKLLFGAKADGKARVMP